MVNAAIVNVLEWATATFSPTQIYFFTLVTIWGPYYWAVSMFFLYLDYYAPAWAQPYKLQPNRKFDIHKFKSAILLVFFNNAVIGGLIISYIIMPHQTAKRDFFSTDLFSVYDFLKWAVMIYLVEDITFYVTHRICHENKWLYQNVHKIHHEWQTPCAMIATYAHPLEHMFVNILPATLGVYLFSEHCLFDFIWFFMACTNTLITHSGYHFPGCIVLPERHDFHHERFTENYGVGLMDMLFGPSVFFKKSIHAITESVYFRPTWFKEARDVWTEKRNKSKRK